MTIFIKAKLKKLDDQTNIDKYRVATNILQNIILYQLQKSFAFKQDREIKNLGK